MIKCYIIDDETHAIAVLERYITQTPGLELAGSQENPLVALQAFQSGQVQADMAFVDVDMPQLSGVELAGLLRPYTGIVFTTAFSNYAVEAFEQNAVDYLLKPIPYERFLRSVDKVHEHLRFKAAPTSTLGTGDYFFIKGEVKGKMIRIQLEEITHIEALQNYIKIHTDSGTHITYLMMKEIEEHLPTDRFFRVHKSFIVHLNRVIGVEGNQVLLDRGSSVPLGARYRESFLGQVTTKLLKSRRLP